MCQLSSNSNKFAVNMFMLPLFYKEGEWQKCSCQYVRIILKYIDGIPKTPSGKVQKPLLREAYLKDRRRMADA